MKLTYRSIGRSLAKELFGYGPWKEMKKGKVYMHKPVHGIFEGAPIHRCGRACLIVPEELVEPVKEAIVQHRGEIKEIVPVIMTQKEAEKMADQYYANYLGIMNGLLKSAYEAKNEKDFRHNMERASRLTKKFEALIKEATEYAEKKPEPKILHYILDGLKEISSQDFEAAKLQVEFLGKAVEGEYNSLLKSLSK